MIIFWGGYEAPGPARAARPAPAPGRYGGLMADSHESGTKSADSAGDTRSAPPGAARRPKPPLRGWRLIVAAARVGQGDAVRILAVAVAVAVITAATEITAEHLADPTRAWQEAVAALVAEGIGLLGTVFLSGFLCRLTGEAGHGRSPVTIRHVLRTLPWRRLILADLIIVMAIVLGLLILVVPGLIVANLLAITGPVIEIENRPVRQALRRSARLVRPYFWRVALLATLPVVVLSELEAAGPEPTGAPEIAEVLAIRGVVDGLLEALVTLVLIQLAYRLIDLDAGHPEAGDLDRPATRRGRLRRKRPAAGAA